MNRKDRRIRLFLEFFFLITGIYIIAYKAWGFTTGEIPQNFFDFQNGTVPVFNLLAQLFAGLSSFVAAWALWSRVTWGPGWCMFTLGLLLYGNIDSMGPAIYNQPAQAIPMVIIVLIVMQSFPFLIKSTQRYS